MRLYKVNLVFSNSCNKRKKLRTYGLNINCKFVPMSIWRVLLSILFPPLAVLDKGCGSIIIVLILTVCGWIPGVIAALIIINNPKN